MKLDWFLKLKIKKEGVTMNYYPDQKNNIYQDPELISVLLTAVAALGSIAAFGDFAINVVKYNKERIKNKMVNENNDYRRHSIIKETKLTLLSLSNSVGAIKHQLESLQDLYHIAKNVNEEHDRIMSFGNGNLWLKNFEAECFYRAQSKIYAEVTSIATNLKLIEELLLTGEEYFEMREMGYDIKTKHTMEQFTCSTNKLLSRFGDISIDEFQGEAIYICREAKRMIENLDENIKRNYSVD